MISPEKFYSLTRLTGSNAVEKDEWYFLELNMQDTMKHMQESGQRTLWTFTCGLLPTTSFSRAGILSTSHSYSYALANSSFSEIVFMNE